MKLVGEDKYLGDYITSDGKHNKTIAARNASAVGQTSAIMTILKEVSLGEFYFPMAVLLRSTLLMSSILLNSEAWVNLSQQNIIDLESSDHTLLRRLLETPVSIGIPGMYLEVGCIPVRFIIMGRRIMFLHYILNCDKNETISKVFWAQKQNPLPNDWSETVQEDIKILGIGQYSIEEISLLKKAKLKIIVKEACKASALKYLLNEIKEKDISKLKNITYNELKMQPYLSSSKKSLKHKKILFKARTKMLNVNWNFGNKSLCLLCKLKDDQQEHLLSCIKIKLESSIILENKNNCKYSDIYSSDQEKLNNIAELLLQATRIREIYLNE